MPTVCSCTGLSKRLLVTVVANVRDLLHQCSIGHYDLLLLDLLFLDKTKPAGTTFTFKAALSRLFTLVMSDEPDASSAVQASEESGRMILLKNPVN